MILKALLLLATVLALAQGQEIVTEFEIRKRHPRREGAEVVGKLTVTIVGQHQVVEAEI